MTVLDRSELQASSLADLHLIADQIGLEGFRRLRKADLIDAILGEEREQGGGPREDSPEESSGRRTPSRRSRSTRSRRGAAATRSADAKSPKEEEDVEEDSGRAPAGRTRPERAVRESASSARRGRGRGEREQSDGPERGRGRGERDKADEPERMRAGVVEIQGNGSAFLRTTPPTPSDHDVYVSAAQVRRCELVPGDLVSGPVRAPRRSERHPSLIRVETINGAPADLVSEGTRYDELPVAYPSERLSFDSEDPTLKAIEWLTPLGRGSRAVIVGSARAGKTETLRRIIGALAGSEGLEVALVLAGVRPEEVAEWRQGPVAPVAALSFAAPADAQGQAVDAAIETAKRLAARGDHAVVLIDSLDGLHPHSARKALAAARNLAEGGSLTVIATAARPFGGETTVIALDALHTSTGRLPALDLVNSATIKSELLVGEDGAEAITRARASAAEG
jgi:transcription termination factor Rho